MVVAIRDVSNRIPYWVYANIIGLAPGAAPLSMYLNDPSTALPLPFVTRGDGTRALPVDTELVIDNATLKIENLFTASTDGLVGGSGYMRMTAVAMADGFTPPVLGLLQSQTFNYIFDPNASGAWERTIGYATDSTINSIPESALTGHQGVVAFGVGYDEAAGAWNSLKITSIGLGDGVDVSVVNDLKGVLATQNFSMGYDATANAWDRIRASGNNVQSVAASTDGIVDTKGHAYLWDLNVAQWNRAYSLDNASDGMIPQTEGIQMVLSHLTAYDVASGNFYRLRSAANNADAVGALSNGVLDINSFPYNWNGATWDRQVPVATEATALNILAALGGAGNSLIFAGIVSTAITTIAYTQIASAAQITADVKAIDIFNGSGSALHLALGALAAEVDKIIIPPGGNGHIPYDEIITGTRVSLKAVTTATIVGNEIIINFFS